MSQPTPDLSPLKQALLTLQRQQQRIRELESAAHEPLAIVGMACRFPGGADSPEAFWELLVQERDAITEVPPGRWDANALHDPDPEAPGRMVSRHGGFCEGIDGFDAAFFRLSPLEARAMDPQQRLLLEVGWEALERAGIVPQRLHGSDTGVFVGIATTDYYSRQQAQAPAEAINAYYFSGGAPSVAAGRLSYLLGLTGPSLSVDTACSSSLTALHLACQSLRSGGCRLALVGGVGLLLTPEPSIAFSKARMLAPDGRCKTFDAAADGYVRGEGCAVLVLKRLSDAQADGDTVLAVVRGTAANQNGPSGGLTVPSGLAQEAVVRQALADAGVAPAQVDVVEAHGTGTALGDPIELRALGQVFGADARAQPLLVGSVKSSIGHLEAAAGLAGVVKMVLALQHGVVPRQLHFNHPTPHFRWEDFPLQVPARACEWPARPAHERLAGVSSFGFAGSNAHVVLGAPPAVPPRPVAGGDGPWLLTLAARTPAALRALAQRHLAQLQRQAAPDAAALCQCSQRERSHFEHRLAVPGADAAALQRGLEVFLAGVPPQALLDGAGTPPALREAARAWLGGEALDWTALDPVARPRVPLPTYPFQRERYWYDQATPAAAASAPPAALLERRIASPFLAALYETRLQPGRPAFLDEHRVGGRTVVAGAHFLALMLEALPGAGDTAVLEDVQFLHALALPPGRGAALQLGIERGDGARAQAPARLTIAATADADDPGAAWTTHAAARLARAGTAAPSPHDTLEAARAQCAEPADPSLLDRHAAATGIELGPAFRTVRELWRGPGAALARLAGPMHPGLLDGCFQTALAALPRLPAHTLVPFAIARVVRHRTPEGRTLWCQALLEPQAPALGGQRLLCALRLWDERGRLCLVMEGFEARAADAATLGDTVRETVRSAAPAPEAWRDWLYRIDWPEQGTAVATGLAQPLPLPEGTALQALVDRAEVERYGAALPRLDALARAYARQALRQLGVAPGTAGPADAGALGVVPAQQRLFARLQRLAREEDGGADPGVLAERLAREHPAVACELRLLQRCGQALAPVLRGHRDPLELLFPDGDASELAAVYGESAAARCMNTLLAEALARALQAWPTSRPVRVLEIGAGTGGSTAALLQRLQPLRAAGGLDYTFTDISPHFFAQARARLGGGAALSWRTLDIERDPAAQGFEPGSFDVVVAANVLHATADLQDSLGHVRQLLAPGGALLLLECVAPQPWLDLVFGLAGGWWRFEDLALRPEHALLAPPAWQALLRRCGFEGGTVLSPDDGRAGPPLHQAVIVAQAPRRAVDAATPRWLILADRGGCGQALGRWLDAHGIPCELAWAGTPPPLAGTWDHAVAGDDPGALARLVAHCAAGPGLAQVVHLWSLDEAEGEDVPGAGCRSALHLVQALAALPRPVRLCFAVAGVPEGPPGALLPAHAPLWGLAKVAALEHPELGCRRIDLGPLRGDAAAAALVAELHAGVPAHGPAEPEVSLRAGRRHVARLVRHATAARPEAAAARIGAEGCYLVTGAFGDLGLLLAEDLVGLGARALVLLGRSAPRPEARARLAALEQAGVRLWVHQGDVCDRAALRAAIEAAESAGAALRGVFHAAGTLDDGPLAGLDTARMETAMAPKVAGAWHLHQLTRGRRLDHFVLYSSVAALLGSAAQASHAAANAFLDALALQRRTQGLAGLSVAWSAWAEIGKAARVGDPGAEAGQRHAARWRRLGLHAMEPLQAQAALRALLADDGAAHVGVLSLDTPRLLLERAGDPLLSALAPQAADAPDSSQAAALETAAPAGLPLLEMLRITPQEAHPELLSEYLREQVANILGWVSPADIDPELDFLELGMDSLGSMELRNRLQAALNCKLPTTLTAEYPTPIALAQHLAALLAAGVPALDDALLPATGLDHLHDQDLDSLLNDLLSDKLA